MRTPLSILGAALVAITMMAGAVPAGAEVPAPNPVKASKGEKCVEPADVMRRNHMDYLKHQRDETLREGIRGQKYSLNECIDCHAAKSPDVAGGRIRTVKPFCGECHSFAAVRIDCFQCHTGAANDRPAKTSSLPAGHGQSDEEKLELLAAEMREFSAGGVKK